MPRRVAAVLIGACVVVVAATWDAAAVAPAVPTGLHLVSATSSSITVGAAKSANAQTYRLFASLDRTDLYVANIAAARSSALTRSPLMTIGGLSWTTKPYYYRVEALNGSARAFSATIEQAGLRPATPTGVRARITTQGAVYLTWNSGGATGFAITQATNPAMTEHRRTYRLRDAGHQFTPLGLARGQLYYFRVRAVNTATPSGYSDAVHAVARSSEQRVRVMSYNILQAISAGTREGGGIVPTWSTRRPGVVALIERDAPDVLAVQEGWPWIGTPEGFGGTRQVDHLRAALDGYALARTEVPPTEHGYRRTGNYILYRAATYAPVGAGGHWTISENRYAAYQELRNRSSGATFLFVSVHLVAGAGAALDYERRAQTASLVRQATAFAAVAHVPVVYAGDFNSDLIRTRVVDGPGVVMRAAHAAEAQRVSCSMSNALYDSYNQYARTPPAYGLDIDRVFVTPGLGVASWGVVLDLVGGKFVGTIPSDHNPVRATVAVPY
jgi:endonuclease/exonuclease/phosphatase family metal-dependent hydrolase